MWDPERHMWFDYNLTARARNVGIYASSFVPLWAGLADAMPVAAKAQLVNAFDAATHEGKSMFEWESGVPSSFISSGQQWDFPNVWAPLVSFAVGGLRRLNLPAADARAFELAQAYVSSAFTGWNSTVDGYMYEKYDCRHAGASGGGGEYVPQNGFGWSNGVAFEMLSLYGKQLTPFPAPFKQYTRSK
jgi:alpha,alpha-trehalase